METATKKKSKVKFATGIFIRPTFTGKAKLKKAATVNAEPFNKQGEIVRFLIDNGIDEHGKIVVKRRLK